MRGMQAVENDEFAESLPGEDGGESEGVRSMSVSESAVTLDETDSCRGRCI